MSDSKAFAPPRGALHIAGRAVRRLTGWGMPRVEALYTVVSLWLGLAFLLAALALMGFVALSLQMSAGATQEIDEAIMRWVDGHGSPTLDRLADSVTALGDPLVMGVMSLLVSAFLWIHGQRRAVALLWIGLLGVALLNGALKGWFERERPAVFEWRSPYTSGFAFPSGHALNVAAAYTLFAFLVARLEGTRALRAATLAVAALVVAGVGASRVYLGVHYPTDVLAGLLVGFAWAMACVFAVYVLADTRAGRTR